jgi:hypothetical protein
MLVAPLVLDARVANHAYVIRILEKQGQL